MLCDTQTLLSSDSVDFFIFIHSTVLVAQEEIFEWHSGVPETFLNTRNKILK